MDETIRTREAIQMLQAGWTVRYRVDGDYIEWRSPDGIFGDPWCSESLDSPPVVCIELARSLGQIVDSPRCDACGAEVPPEHKGGECFSRDQDGAPCGGTFV